MTPNPYPNIVMTSFLNSIYAIALAFPEMPWQLQKFLCSPLIAFGVGPGVRGRVQGCHPRPPPHLGHVKTSRKVFVALKLGWYSLDLRCPRVFFRSPQMWQMKMGIRHFLRKDLFFNSKRHILSHFLSV